MKSNWDWLHTITLCASMWIVVICIRIWWKIEDKIRSKKREKKELYERITALEDKIK